MIEEYILLVMKAAPKGSYERNGEEYSFMLGDDISCIITVTSSALEFKIPTIKWLPGSYEPIEGSELYKRITYNEMESLSKEEKLFKIGQVLNNLNKN